MPKKSKPAVPGYDGPRKTALESIRLFCLGCMGGQRSLVTECPSTNCVFYPYRSGVIEEGADRRLLRIIKSYCAEQCLPAEDPAGCTAGKGFLDLDPCPVWPFRLGRNPYYGDKRRERLREHAISSGWEANFRPRLDGKGPVQTSGRPEGKNTKNPAPVGR